MGFMGWIGFDIFTLIASYLSAITISAQTIMRTMGLLTFMVPVGFANASAVLIGQYIGAGKPELVRYYYKLSVYCSITIALIMNVILFAF